jgi:agmatine/peptidylarginine deiminase
MSADFEEVDRVLLAWTDEVSVPLIDVLAVVSPEMPVTMVVDPDDGVSRVAGLVGDAGVDLSMVDFVEANVEAPWMRDFGPIVARRGDERRLVDFSYPSRPNADLIPHVIGERILPGADLVEWDVAIDGGNLLSNGAGFCVTSDDSRLTFDQEDQESRVRSALRRSLGCNELVFLQPLIDEPTGHVDMFMMFTSVNEVLVGSYEPDVDENNSIVLDRAAETLADHGFRVTRVPMPSNSDGFFRTYVNALVLNHMVLMPVYDHHPEGRLEALDQLEASFPERVVVPIEAGEMIKLEGAIHCLAQTVAR